MANKGPWEALDLLVVKSGYVRTLTILLILISVAGARTQSPRDVEIEKVLRKVNKPPIKTLQSPDGEIIDCVDIYKQPAFDHPLLKNHMIEMRPSFDLGMVNRSNYLSEYAEPIWRQNGSCPERTIPIQRVKKSDLLRAESLECFGRVHHNPNTPSTGRVELAMVRMESDPQSFYNGVGGDVSVWRPHVENAEYSTSAISVVYQENAIHAGWGVFPRVFGDTEPRIYVAWMAREGNSVRGCFNLLCPGFIQTNRAFVLGSTLPISTPGGRPSIVQLLIQKNADHQWWVKINGVNVGYYPAAIFPHFNMAQAVDWGGSIFNTMNSGHHTITQMGSGNFAGQGYGRAAHFENIFYLDHHSNLIPVVNPQKKVTFPHCYNVILHQHASATSVFYGGPGGTHCDRAGRG